jgi:hypothetical protein
MIRKIEVGWLAQGLKPAACLGLLVALAVAIAPRKSAASPAHGGSSKVSSGVVFTPDKGTFKILAGGKEAGQEDFEVSPSGGDWIVRGTSTIQTAKGPTHVTGTLELHPNGSPVRYEWSTDGEKTASATVTFDGPAASIALNLANTQPYTQQLTFGSVPVAVLDNNLYDQYAVLGDLYDWSKKGVQTFSVLVPQELTPGTVTVESLGKQDSNGKQMDELRVKTDDLELDLFFDRGRLMRIAAPGSDAEIVRD